MTTSFISPNISPAAVDTRHEYLMQNYINQLRDAGSPFYGRQQMEPSRDVQQAEAGSDPTGSIRRGMQEGIVRMGLATTPAINEFADANYRNEFTPREARYRFDEAARTIVTVDPADAIPRGPGYEYAAYAAAPVDPGTLQGFRTTLDIKSVMPLLDDLTTAQWEQLAAKLSEVLTANNFGEYVSVRYYNDKAIMPRRPVLSVTTYRRQQAPPVVDAVGPEHTYIMRVDPALEEQPRTPAPYPRTVLTPRGQEYAEHILRNTYEGPDSAR